MDSKERLNIIILIFQKLLYRMGRVHPGHETRPSSVQSPRLTGFDSVFGSPFIPLELPNSIIYYADSLVRK